MPNTYTQIHLQIVFVVKYRDGVIHQSWKDKLYGYITGIVQANEHKMLIINGVPDHVHLLIGMRPSQSISDLMQDIKGSSSEWINDNKLVKGKFEWQAGYGAFSYSKSDLKNVIEYIKNQEAHHAQRSFVDELREMVESAQLEWKPDFLP